MNKIFKYSILFLIISAVSCKKENLCDCFKGTGDIVNETRDIKGFDKIVTEDNVNVFITQDSIFEVKVEAGKHLIKLISTEVNEGELRIKNNNRCNFVRTSKKEINVYLKMPAIKYITSEGYGKIQSLNTLTTAEFDVRTKSTGDVDLIVNNSKIISHMFGNGDIYFRGITGEHSCHVVGEGFVNCSGLSTQYTWIYSRTSGYAYINVTNLLQIIIESSGNVYYTGKPQIQATINGSGGVYAQ
jgi:hypothetical protein